MIKKLSFGKRIGKIIGSSIEFLFTLFFMLIILIFSAYLLIGFIQLIGTELNSNSIDFAKYLTTLAFTLGGFTFLSSTLIKRTQEKRTLTEIDILNTSYNFLVSGFFGLLFIGLKYLPEYTFIGKPLENYTFMKEFIFPVSIIISIGFFLGGLFFLIFLLRVKIPLLYKETPKKKHLPWKRFFKKSFGLD